MNEKPLVSVIIPTYNRLNKIAIAIESALAQTYTNIQLIVSDDGSTDGTEAFIKQHYPQLDYVLHEHGGQAAARNGGLALAKGSIIASLDSDDKWEPGFLETCVEKLEADQLDFVFTNWQQQFLDGSFSDFLSGDKFLEPYFKHKDGIWQMLSADDLRALYLLACPSPSSSAVIRKSSIVNGWNERINISDDWCMFLDMILTKPCKAAFSMEVRWNKFINTNNIYDGRKRSEVLELFYIEDTLEFMGRFKDKLNKREQNELAKRCIRGLVELAKHHIFREHNFIKAAELMKDASKMNVLYTLWAIPGVILFGFDRHFKELKVKILGN